MQAKPYIREYRIEEMVDPGIKGQYCSEAMWRVLEVASVCTEPFSTFRPTMEDVLREADVVRFIILQYSIYYYIYIDIISTGIHTKEQLNCTIN